MDFIEHIIRTKPIDIIQESIQYFEPDNIRIIKHDDKGDTWHYYHHYRDDLSPSKWLNNVPRSFWDKYFGYPLGHISEVDFPEFINGISKTEILFYNTISGKRCVLIASLDWESFVYFITYELPYNRLKEQTIISIIYGYQISF